MKKYLAILYWGHNLYRVILFEGRKKPKKAYEIVKPIIMLTPDQLKTDFAKLEITPDEIIILKNLKEGKAAVLELAFEIWS